MTHDTATKSRSRSNRLAADKLSPFAEMIYQAMKDLNFKRLEDFADHFDIGRTTVYSLVTSRKSPDGRFVQPSIDTLFKFETALNRPVTELIEVFRVAPAPNLQINYQAFAGILPMKTSAVTFQNELRDEDSPKKRK